MKIARLVTGAVARLAAVITGTPRAGRKLEQLRGLREVHLTEDAPAPVPAPLAEAGAKGPVPSTADIQEAARLYEQARQQTNAAARTKRRAEKTLSRTPDGTYGPVTLERAESGRQTADLDAIREIFAAHGLGDIPMKPCAPSLTIAWAAESTNNQTEAALVAA
ncbi:hypothetical protein AB0O34_35540 [Sphaerisporangium sp. NPDC088356]|uniref:hypothetical protein n=1 Tax=Sphaerisporangium sp. NPDC088356 TaxID=3154871 RepID=UPI0034125CF3